MSEIMARACPACGSDQIEFTARGYAGSVDSPDQFITCRACNQITYQIVAVAQRDVRLHNYIVGGRFERGGTRYEIRRILKVGFNEYLLYVQPESRQHDVAGSARSAKPAS